MYITTAVFRVKRGERTEFLRENFDRTNAFLFLFKEFNLVKRIKFLFPKSFKINFFCDKQ